MKTFEQWLDTESTEVYSNETDTGVDEQYIEYCSQVNEQLFRTQYTIYWSELEDNIY